MWHGRRLTVAGTAVAVGVTALVAALDGLAMARSLPLHVAMEAAATVIAAMAAVLAYGRAHRMSAPSDVLLVGALSVLALTNLCFSLVPALAGDPHTAFATWAAASGRTAGTLGLLAAAWAPVAPR